VTVGGASDELESLLGEGTLADTTTVTRAAAPSITVAVSTATGELVIGPRPQG
jgi:hypothetical protein